MANNRLILRCNCKTDAGLFLAKHMDRGWYCQDYHKLNTGEDGEDFRVALNKYYDKHESCFYELGDEHLYLTTENETPTEDDVYAKECKAEAELYAAKKKSNYEEKLKKDHQTKLYRMKRGVNNDLRRESTG